MITNRTKIMLDNMVERITILADFYVIELIEGEIPYDIRLYLSKNSKSKFFDCAKIRERKIRIMLVGMIGLKKDLRFMNSNLQKNAKKAYNGKGWSII